MSDRLPPKEDTGFQREAIDRMLENSQFFDNVAQEFIYTTVDKVKLCLIEHRDALKAQGDWVAPLGILLALVATLVAADFKTFLGIAAEVWESLHILALIGSIIWLVYAVYRAAKTRDQGNIENIIRALKEGSPATGPSSGTRATAHERSLSLFRDTFEGFSEWKPYGKGNVSQSQDVPPHSGTYCLKKSGNNDPNGGFRAIGSDIGLGIVFSGWIYRRTQQEGGQADRLAVEDGQFNGYGFAVDHNKNTAHIERRNAGKKTRISSEVSLGSQPELLKDRWYGFELYVRKGSHIELRLVSDSGEEILVIPTVSDKTCESFDRVVVHGGHPYYVDDLEIQTRSHP